MTESKAPLPPGEPVRWRSSHPLPFVPDVEHALGVEYSGDPLNLRSENLQILELALDLKSERGSLPYSQNIRS
jgi:hypothetical protein